LAFFRPDLKHLQYPLPQVPSTENLNPCLDSLFSPNLKSLAVQTVIGVDLLQFPLELFGIHTGGIERFSARKNFSKILQVSHFHLGFSSGKNNNEIIHFHRVVLEILDPDLENTNETL